MKAKNNYSIPMKLGSFTKIDRISSPAHVGNLKNSVDFICNEGAEIISALEGKVISIKQDSGVGGEDMKKYWNDGNYIEIEHENGEYTYYEHLIHNGAVVKVGDTVETGQLIGYAGSTGFTYTFGPHVHFEVYIKTGPDQEKDYETLEVKFEDYEE